MLDFACFLVALAVALWCATYLYRAAPERN